jgi:MFS family permease
MSKPDLESSAINVVEEPTARHVSHTIGTVHLIEGGKIRLVPTPSLDPYDPLNLPRWRKWAITVLTSLCEILRVLSLNLQDGTIGLTVVSGIGTFFPNMYALYLPQGITPDKINLLASLPALMMGAGNFFCVPFALAVGRRPVFLFSTFLLAATCGWAAGNHSYGSHLAARCVMGFATGQIEALVPLIVEECHFLHERGARIGFVWACQVLLFVEVFLWKGLGSTAFLVISSYMISGFGWRWWYGKFVFFKIRLTTGFFCIFISIVGILSFLLLAETKYERSSDDLGKL